VYTFSSIVSIFFSALSPAGSIAASPLLWYSVLTDWALN